jgi:hypothetical protein
MSAPIGSILIVAVLGYLFLLATLTIAVLIVVRGAKDGRAGGCTGCAIALAIVIAAGVGAVGCTAVVAVATGSEVIKHGPVRSIDLEYDWGTGSTRPQGSWRSSSQTQRGEYPVRLQIELDGPVDVGRIARWIRDEIDGDVSISYEVLEQSGEGRRTVLDIGLPIDPDDMADFERELRRELPELTLPSAIRIEIRSDEDDD